MLLIANFNYANKLQTEAKNPVNITFTGFKFGGTCGGRTHDKRIKRRADFNKYQLNQYLASLAMYWNQLRLAVNHHKSTCTATFWLRWIGSVFSLLNIDNISRFSSVLNAYPMSSSAFLPIANDQPNVGFRAKAAVQLSDLPAPNQLLVTVPLALRLSEGLDARGTVT